MESLYRTASNFGDWLGAQSLIYFPVVSVLILAAIILGAVPVLVLAERRGAAWIQRRSGPNRVGPFGLFQTVADAIKLIFKEANLPKRAHLFLFLLAPALAVIPPFVALAVIPLGGDVLFGPNAYPFQGVNLSVGLLFFLAISSLHVYSVLTAGWASNNKFSLMGGLRSSSQMISYEIVIGMAIVSLVITYGTLDLREIVYLQQSTSGALPAWGVFKQPVVFVLLWICSFAETNRLPFDLPEGESELVAGYHTEYSGLTFALFMMGEYVAMLAASAFLSTLFLGGFNIPFITEAELLKFFLDMNIEQTAASIMTVACQFAALAAKIGFFMWVFIWVRWSLPRFRYDQLMSLGWKVLLPISVMNVIGTMLYSYFAAGGAA
ncbi:NADH-quinone oxidoreductase subunit NuoH [bacterium]|nr:NADH-quinone oxidoreductase subunit NuoH [bacterium]